MLLFNIAEYVIVITCLQGLAFGFILLRVESLTEEGKI